MLTDVHQVRELVVLKPGPSQDDVLWVIREANKGRDLEDSGAHNAHIELRGAINFRRCMHSYALGVDMHRVNGMRSDANAVRDVGATPIDVF